MNTKDNYSCVPWFASRDYRAVASFVCLFVFWEGGAISQVPKARILQGGLGVFSPRRVSNLEAPKRYFQHLS